MKVISRCPACSCQLKIRTLLCPDCGLELKNDFEFSPFDRLSTEQTEFLLSFLRCRGNLSQLQDEMQLSYLTAKRKLSELLEALELTTNDDIEEETLNMNQWKTDVESTKASEIIKRKRDRLPAFIQHSCRDIDRIVESETVPAGTGFT